MTKFEFTQILSNALLMNEISEEAASSLYDCADLFCEPTYDGEVFQPEFGKAEPHGFDNREISWGDFLEIRRCAQICANKIGYPIYLVGSALHKEVPRDIDIVCIIPAYQYEFLFGELPSKQKDLCNYLANVIASTFDKMEELHTCLMTTHHLDIKVYPDVWFVDKPKLLIGEPGRIHS